MENFLWWNWPNESGPPDEPVRFSDLYSKLNSKKEKAHRAFPNQFHFWDYFSDKQYNSWMKGDLKGVGILSKEVKPLKNTLNRRRQKSKKKREFINGTLIIA